MVTATLAWQIAAAVPDPEVPVLTIEDLGVLRDVVVDGGRATVTITPTMTPVCAVAEAAAATTASSAASVDPKRPA